MVDTRKNIIVLGASRYYAKAIEAVRDAGYRVIAVDRNPDSAGFQFANEFEVCDIVDPEGVRRIAEKWHASAVVPVNDYGVMTASLVSKYLNLKGISPQAADLATKKSMMRKKWAEDGVPCPPFKVVSSAHDLVKAIDEIGIPCILKPAVGCGGASRGVIVIRSEDEIEEAIRFTLSFYEDQTTLVEGFVDSVSEHSAEVLITDGKVYIIAIGDKIKTPLPYRVDKDVLYPTNINKAAHENIRHEIERAVLSLGVNVGAAHIEFAIDQNGGLVFFEMGARCGGGGTSAPIVPYASGVNIFVELVRILSGDKPERLVPVWSKGCCYHFLTPEPGEIKSLKGMKEMKDSEEVLDAEFFHEVGSTIPQVKVGTDRAGFIIAGGDDREMAYKNACNAERFLSINSLSRQ